MKKTFTPKEIYDNRGCYTKEQVDNLSFIRSGQQTITLVEILQSEISIRDKRWFLYNDCDMDLKQRIDLALLCAKAVLPVYENSYPKDKRVRECLEAIDLFNEGKITSDDLMVKGRAADDACVDAAGDAYVDAAYAAYAARTAADATAYVDAAYAAYAAYAAAYDATYAAYYDAAYAAAVQQLFIEFVNAQD